MDLAQRLRRLLKGATGRRLGPERPAIEDATPPPHRAPPRLKLAPALAARWLRWGAVGLGVILLLYYPLGAILDHKINDDPRFSPPDPGAGRSQAVAMAAALIAREVDDTGWVANTPPFAPNALLKVGGNMVNFQSGMITALGRFAFELEGQLGRTRGGSAADPDLKIASGRLQTEPQVWIFQPGYILPRSPADDEYRKARRALLAYNERLGEGEAIYDIRPDNLLAVLERIALDLGSASDELQQQIAAGRKVFIDFRADKLLYNVKGRAYAYLMILKALRVDFAEVIADRGVDKLYDEMLAHLERAAVIKPLMTQNGAPDGVLANNHLAAQGFYLLRARTRMREITDILKK